MEKDKTIEDKKEISKLLNEDTKEQEKKTSCVVKLKGIFFVFTWVPLMIASTTSVQLLERQIPDLELNTMRCAVAAVLFTLGTCTTRKWPVIPKSEILCTSLFALLSFTGTVCHYISVTFIPLSTAQSIFITSGLISGLILFAIFLADRITVKKCIFVLLCVGGVILVIQPDFIFPSKVNAQFTVNNVLDSGNVTVNETMTTEIHSKYSTLQVAIGYLLAIVPGLTNSANLLNVKKHLFLQEHKMEALFWLYWFGTTLSLVAMAIFETPVLPKSWLQLGYVIVHSTTYVMNWPLYMLAARYISGNTINVIISTSVVFMLIPQYTLLSSILPGNRNWIEVVGVFLVLLGSILASLIEFFHS